jgi:hypothetical protein
MGQSILEKRAAENWCPETRIASIITTQETPRDRDDLVTEGPAVTAVNRHPERRKPFEGSYCVGARCMHWDWMSGAVGPDKKGFCGLSGRPSR